MLSSRLDDLYELQWLGAADAAAAHGADFVCFVGGELAHPDGYRSQANSIYELAGEERLDGLVVWTTALEMFVGGKAMDEFCRRFDHLPIVSVERVLAGSPSVLMDERQGMDDAVSHLIEAHGCERIAFIRGPAHHTGAEHRYRGYRDALARHGLRFDPALAPAVPFWGPEPAATAATELLTDGSSAIDAFATANDDLALGVLGALDAFQLRAPHDVAVVGFDDHVNLTHHGFGLELMMLSNVGEARAVNLTAAVLPLTTVRAPFYQLGWRAVELLLERLGGRAVPDVVTIPTELVVRRSCGCFSSAVREVVQRPVPRKRSRYDEWEHVAREMRHALSRSDASLPADWPERLEAAFAKDVETESTVAFLDVLDELTRASIRAGDTLDGWSRALSALRRYTASAHASADTSPEVEDFWLRVQSVMGELAARLNDYEHFVAARRDRIVRSAGRRLIATHDAEELADVLADELPELGIPSCYVATYRSEREGDEADPQRDSQAWSRALLIQEAGHRRELRPSETDFRSRKLAPVPRLGSANPSSTVAMPLYFQERQLGFVLFEVGPRLGWVYGELQEQLSSALQSALLVDRERRALAAVEQAHDELEQRVALRTSELATANEALAKANEVLTEQMVERERAEAQQARLEAQLLQAQKIEAIGRLAGGIAHDFNNMLVVINGFSELLLARADADDPVRTDLEQIRQAGERAADLTRRLLAFSRQQVIQPRVLDLNEVISNLEPMLQRLIGEDIELTTSLAPSLSAIRADRGQIEQIILNLALNARDAMPNGGRLIIDAGDVDLDQRFTTEHIGLDAGRHVKFRVTDTGVGMDADTQARLFDPFFTTKPAGRGTGLGLSTVFVSVQQSGGHIEVSSAPGRGTTFEIYLPSAEQSAGKPAEAEPTRSSLRGSETILLVEDDAGVRNASRCFLEEHGYRVIEAADGGEALRLYRLHEGDVDLVITDLVMPGMSGRELAERMTHQHPETPVLFVSGYVDSARTGLDDLAFPLLEKPFGADLLARKVRETIDSRIGS